MCCDSEILALEKEVKNLEIKIKSIKQEYLNLFNINIQKDLSIRKIKQNIKQNIEENKFKSFDTILSEDCLTKLRLIGNSQSEDGQFVSVVFKALYNNDIQIVKAKCLSNRTKNPEKSVITPEKRIIVERIFAERLGSISIVDDARKNSLSKLIRNMIDGAVKKR